MNMFSRHRSEKGFTLIELLVVIAIIGILSSVVLASLNSARVKARDARRVADLKQIQVAEELYYDANGYYSDSIAQLVGGSAGQSLAVEPKDPQSGESYSYAIKGGTGTATAYHVGANMEQAVDGTTLDTGDIDMVTSGAAGWTGGFFGSSANGVADPGTINCANVAGTSFCYDISNVNTP